MAIRGASEKCKRKRPLVKANRAQKALRTDQDGLENVSRGERHSRSCIEGELAREQNVFSPGRMARIEKAGITRICGSDGNVDCLPER
jgi:hypothetical protein